MDDQTVFQFTHHIQRTVALLWFERIDGEKQPLPSKFSRMLNPTQVIRATRQHQEHTNQIQYFAFSDRHTPFLAEHFMNLCDGPTLPKAPVANLDNDLQGETAAAHGQAFSRTRGVDAPASGITAPAIAATIGHADHQLTSAQEDHVLAPPRVGSLQCLPTAWARRLLRMIISFGNALVVFRSSHLSRSQVRTGLMR